MPPAKLTGPQLGAQLIAMRALLIQAVALVIEAHGDVRPGDVLAVMAGRARRAAEQTGVAEVKAEIDEAIASFSNEVLYAIDERKAES